MPSFLGGRQCRVGSACAVVPKYYWVIGRPYMSLEYQDVNRYCVKSREVSRYGLGCGGGRGCIWVIEHFRLHKTICNLSGPLRLLESDLVGPMFVGRPTSALTDRKEPSASGPLSHDARYLPCTPELR